MMKTKSTWCMVMCVMLCLAACNKYLDQKSNQKLVVPQTLADMQSILDSYTKNWLSDPGSGEVSSTDYYLTDAGYNALTTVSSQRMYIWQKTYLFEPASNEWYQGYTSLYSANSVLQYITNVPRTTQNQSQWDGIKGQALFLRAKIFFNMSNIWTLPYDPQSSSADLGLPLRLTTDFNEKSVRSTVQQTFDQLLQDMKSAIPLLPETPVQVMRPSKPAAYGMLARIYLAMRNYNQAGLYADSCLQLFNPLIDFNTLNSAATNTMAQFNAETVFYGQVASPLPTNPSRAKIDLALYNSYDANDLRKVVYFKNNNDGTFAFKANYTGNVAPFDGIATDEIYLIRSECFARQNSVSQAMSDLNTLLVKRYKKGTFITLSASDATTALNLVLTERHKELLNRGLRWQDIRRLNKEGANITLTRTVNGVVYTLPPNDLRYALPIPEDVISLSGIVQNP